MSRAYLRLDPAFDERKESYPDGPYAALICVFCLAESQPFRGRFRSTKYLKTLMGRRGRHLAYLMEHGDIIEDSAGRLYVDGWDEWQEGDWKVGERLERLRVRREAHGFRRNGSGPRATAGATVEPLATATPSRFDSGALHSEAISGGPLRPPTERTFDEIGVTRPLPVAVGFHPAPKPTGKKR